MSLNVTTATALATTEERRLDFDKIKKTMSDAANQLRGPISAAELKDYVFPLLFWKWLSENFLREQAEAISTPNGAKLYEVDPTDYHALQVPFEHMWSEVTRDKQDLGRRIDDALSAIEGVNPELEGIFGSVNWADPKKVNDETMSRACSLLADFSVVDLAEHDMLGHAYEYLLSEFAMESGKKTGEFYTPAEVTHVLVDILNPQRKDSICDPAAGTGGMLIEAFNKVKHRDGEAAARGLSLYAQEVSVNTAAIAKMNLFMRGVKHSEVVHDDTLRAPGLRDETGGLRRFDVTLANPPYSLGSKSPEGWGNDQWLWDERAQSPMCGVPPKGNADYAFIQHLVYTMKPETGRAGVVMPHGVLFRGGEEGRIRKCLVENDMLEAVVALPAKLFYSASLPVVLLIFRSEKSAERKNHVLFVDGSQRFVPGKRQNHMSADDQNAIVRAYRTGEDPDGEGGVNVRLVPFDEIKSNGFDLNIGRYIAGAGPEIIDLATALSTFHEAAEKQAAAEQSLFERLAAAGIEVAV